MWGDNRIKLRQLEIDQVAQIFGFDSVTKLDFDTTQLDILPLAELTERISTIHKKIKPEKKRKIWFLM